MVTTICKLNIEEKNIIFYATNESIVIKNDILTNMRIICIEVKSHEIVIIFEKYLPSIISIFSVTGKEIIIDEKGIVMSNEKGILKKYDPDDAIST